MPKFRSSPDVSNMIDRAELKTEFERGEIGKEMFDRDYERLTKADNDALRVTTTLDRYIQADKPFAHPFYWAGFTCQGLG